MKRITLGIAASLFILLLSGCSSMAPNYVASVDNVEVLKKAGDFHARVGSFTSISADGNANPISIRGMQMTSPYQNSFAIYVAEAVKQELVIAKKMSPDAGIELTGMLLKNDISADIGTGHAHIKVQFIVKRDTVVRYDRVKSIEHQWDSSFAGAIAVPRAMQEYPVMIQKLLASFYADQDFITAIQ